MNVETFECHEVSAEPIEACEEAARLIDELGLDGQKSLAAPKEDAPDTRCPYRQITAEEQFVYQTLCPTAVPLSEYDASPVPLRVLQVASHAQSLDFFSELRVWDKQAGDVEDPVLVALDRHESSYQRKTYILARWGNELETFTVLMARAVQVARERHRAKLQEILSEVQAKLAAVDTVSAAKLAESGPGRDFSFYCGF